MKKSLLALAVLGAFAGVAQAQSSVTLFGIVDLAARSVTNSSETTRYLANDGNATSRLGVRGVEDLGGGLKAGFWLEGALTPDDGTAAGQTWKRRSTLSLMGKFGEVRLGRDYTPTFWNHTVYDPFGTNGVGSHNNMMTMAGTDGVQATKVNGGASTFVRSNNTVGYFTPAFGALSAQLQYGMPEGAADARYFGGRVVYAAGPLSVAGQAGTTAQGSKKDENSVGVAGSYDFGPVKLMAQFNRYTIVDDNVGAGGAVRNPRLTNFLIGATAPVGSGVTLKASFNSTSARTATVDNVDGKQLALGAVYDLSKRTALYGTYSRISNGDNGTYAVADTKIPLKASQVSSGYEVGVRHSF